MNATAVGTGGTRGSRDSAWELYKGWILGLAVIVSVLAVGAGLWLHFHP